MKGALVLLTVAATASANMMMKQMLERIDMYNFNSKCWGENNVDLRMAGLEQAKAACMHMEPPFDLAAELSPRVNPFSSPATMHHALDIFSQLQQGGDLSQVSSLWRPKREAATAWDMATGVLGAGDSHLYDFLQQFGDFKHGVASKMGNLSCVLTQVKMLTPDMKINLDYWTSAMASEETEAGFVWEEGTAAFDPAWRQKMSEGYTDCHKLSEYWPQGTLDRNPLTRLFGRNMIFFKCFMKHERKLCAEAQMLTFLKKKHGAESDEQVAANIDRLGLPEDKYDAAAISVAVIKNAMTEEEHFVDDFMWGVSHEM